MEQCRAHHAVSCLRGGRTLASCQVDLSARIQVCLPRTPTRPPCRLHRLTVQSREDTSSRSCPPSPCTPAHRTLLIPAGCARQQASCRQTRPSWFHSLLIAHVSFPWAKGRVCVVQMQTLVDGVWGEQGRREAAKHDVPQSSY